MRKGFVGLGHSVDVVAFFDSVAHTIEGVDQNLSQFIGHRLTFASASGPNNPTKGERILTVAAHRHRHLIVRATDTTRAHLYLRSDHAHDFFERFDRFFFESFGHFVESGIDDTLRDGFFTAEHDAIDKSSQHDTAVFGIWFDLASFNLFSTHKITDYFLAAFGRLAP